MFWSFILVMFLWVVISPLATFVVAYSYVVHYQQIRLDSSGLHLVGILPCHYRCYISSFLESYSLLTFRRWRAVVFHGKLHLVTVSLPLLSLLLYFTTCGRQVYI